MTDFEKEGTVGWITRLFGHLAWADGTLLERLEQVPNAEALRLLAHVVVAERIWLGRIRGEGLPLAPWDPQDLEQVRSLAQEVASGFTALLPGLTSERLTDSVQYRNSRGDAHATALGDILLHVAMHGAPHRGQICSMLAPSGQAPALDYFLYAMERPVG